MKLSCDARNTSMAGKGHTRVTIAFVVAGLVAANMARAEFKDLFAPNHWKVTTNQTGAALDMNEAPRKITFICNGAPGSEAAWSIQVPLDGEITFDWRYTPNPQSTAPDDSAGWSTGSSRVPLTSSDAAAKSGRVTVPVKAGQPFAFWIRRSGESHAASRLTIQNFTFNGLLRIDHIGVGTTNVQVAFDSMPGRTHRVQACRDLTTQQWVDVSSDILAVDAETFYSIARQAGDTMFYRVVLLPE